MSTEKTMITGRVFRAIAEAFDLWSEADHGDDFDANEHDDFTDDDFDANEHDDFDTDDDCTGDDFEDTGLLLRVLSKIASAVLNDTDRWTPADVACAFEELADAEDRANPTVTKRGEP